MQYKPSTPPTARSIAGCMIAIAVAVAPVAAEQPVAADASGHHADDHQVVPTSYVGDMPCCDAGVACSGGSCDGGCCDGGGCHSGGRLASILASMFGHGDNGGMVIGRSYGQPDLFYNFYTQGNANRTNAQMYLSPLPIPPNVGHTFYTYQPFYPHHMLYWHRDKFHRYYDYGRGMNRTKATYYSPPLRQALSNIYWNCIRLPR